MTRWNRYYKKQLQDKEFKALVEQELASLRIGARLAAIREEAGLTQTKLAARAGMASSKVSAIESQPQNLELGTLIRLALAANRKVEVSFPKGRSRR
ncbi:MAG: helix-turn-helix domain-containing protein [Candidatus Acidiferrales bacterium]